MIISINSLAVLKEKKKVKNKAKISESRSNIFYIRLWFDVSLLIYCYKTIFNILFLVYLFNILVLTFTYILLFHVEFKFIWNSFPLTHFRLLVTPQPSLSFISFHFISVLFTFPLRDFHVCFFAVSFIYNWFRDVAIQNKSWTECWPK